MGHYTKVLVNLQDEVDPVAGPHASKGKMLIKIEEH